MNHIRRVVTGHDDNNQSVVISDGTPPRSLQRPSGLTTTLLWSSTEMPIAASYDDKDMGDLDYGIPPSPSGTIFRILEFPPENLNPSPSYDYLKEDGAHSQAEKPHPGMHETETVDYAVVISGRITLILDAEEVDLKAGDVVIQRLTNHAWSNRGTESCRIAFVLVDAQPRSGK